MGLLFNVRQDITSRAAYEYNRHSTSSLYLMRCELVGSGGPQLNVGALSPGDLFGGPMVKRVRHHTEGHLGVNAGFAIRNDACLADMLSLHEPSHLRVSDSRSWHPCDSEVSTCSATA